jgi:DNA replication and repair protein RecF
LKGDPEQDRQALAQSGESELRAGHALYGPHRDDFEMTLGEERREAFFSQGEYRVALLALKLALNELLRARMAFRPVIILDDLYSELDEGVRSRLTAYLAGAPNQIFITTTEPPETIGLPEARVMEIREGRVV